MKLLRHPKAPLVIGSVMILALVAYVTLYRSSPGELARPHALVAGSSFINDCNLCHKQKDVSPGCLGCHTEIAEEMKTSKGLHPFLLKGKKAGCAACHSEHNGPDFALVSKVSWQGQDPKSFKHAHVTFRLTGKHEKLACSDCHRGARVPPFSLPKYPGHLRPDSYLGLSQNCQSCHQDVHSNGMTGLCERCHNQIAWKPAPGFNHAVFFPLSAAHEKVSCQKCHPRPSASSRNANTRWFPFNEVKGKSCRDCHDNPHNASWKTNCETCHRAEDGKWQDADKRMTSTLHALSGFHLSAPHAKASCRDCHAPGLTFAKKYPNPGAPGYRRRETNCESCHRDPHQGQFRQPHARCLDCHGRKSFVPAVFPIDAHTTFPLTGRHRAVSCNVCHVKNRLSGQRLFASTPAACAGCHKDPHYGQFRQDGRTTCENCHRSAESWKILIFDHNRQARFKLDQAHAKVSCKDCHPVVSLKNGTRLIQYKPLRMQCKDCHDFNQ